MALGRYGLGLALLLSVVGSTAFGGIRLRQRLLPLWSGAIARLAEVVIALSIFVAVVEILGTVGLFRLGFVVAGCVASGVALGASRWPRLRASQHRPDAPRVHSPALAAMFVGAGLVITQWAVGVKQAFNGGMLGPDTLAYHGPIAASFVQQASIVHPPWVYGDPVVASFPATSELFHAVGILLFTRDVMSPLMNISWLVLALLAAWCVGRPRGLGPASVLFVAVIVDVPVLSTSQPGSGDNDIMALALLISSVALLTNAYPSGTKDRFTQIPTAAIGLAGAAAGLAMSTKFSMAAPIGLLAVGVLAVLPGVRRRIAWTGPLIAANAIWLIRNFVAFGNPVPALHLRIGSVGFPSPVLPRSYSVADFLTASGIWKNAFLPGLHWAFTFIWPALLGLALLGAIGAVLSGPTRLDRMLGPVAVLAAVGYIFTPRTADGPLVFFQFNLRYLVPAMLLGVLLLFRSPRTSRAFRSSWSLVLPAVGLAATLSQGPSTGVAWAFLAVAVASLAFAGRLIMARWARRPARIALLALGALGLLIWPSERNYLRARYTGTGPFACELLSCTPFLFIQSLHGVHIAFGGSLGPYLLYGRDLSNRVTIIGHRGAHRAWTPISSCRAWRSALASAPYDYVVTSGPYYLYQGPSSLEEARWTRSDPAATELSTTPAAFGTSISVFKVHGRLSRGSCT